MADPRFYDLAGPFRVSEICERIGAELATPDLADKEIAGVAAIADAGADQISFVTGKKYRASLAEGQAGACLMTADLVDAAPEGTACLVVGEPQKAFADAIALFHGEAYEPGIHAAANVDPSARLEEGVTVCAGAFVGAGAEIGRGTVIREGTVIGAGVTVGRNCRIGPNASVEKSLIGNDVLIYANAAIGQDGFGYAMGFDGHKKIPQIGRVVVQDKVEIGACTTIDRGALDDTVIGEGTKIDNLVQIGHNCRIGRHCVIVGMVGLSGSTTLEDFVVLGGQVGSAGHVTIGAGSMVAARAGIKDDLPPGGVYGGAPAKPAKEWMREIAAVSLLAKRGTKKK